MSSQSWGAEDDSDIGEHYPPTLLLAGATIIDGLLGFRIPLFTRRVNTLVPALIFLGAGTEPTLALLRSQVLL
ncbi:hypothetical protein [Arthrobacter sp. S39]|uniref:hypothetical protein n=1 Tax=Arthrobacter sp. S39 TaxID=2509720 RepID=UPI00325BF90C